MQDKRRELLKALTLGGGAAAATQLPKSWKRPVVDSVMLPVHAQTTGAGLFITESFLADGQPNGKGSREQFAFGHGKSNIPAWLPISIAQAGGDRPESTFDVTRSVYVEAQGGGAFLVQYLVIQTILIDPQSGPDPVNEPCDSNILFQKSIVVAPHLGGFFGTGTFDVSDSCGTFPGPSLEFSVTVNDIEAPTSGSITLGESDTLNLNPGGVLQVLPACITPCEFVP